MYNTRIPKINDVFQNKRTSKSRKTAPKTFRWGRNRNAKQAYFVI